MSGICSTKPLVGAGLDGAGSGLPSLAPPPALASLGVGCGASSILSLLVACADTSVYRRHAQNRKKGRKSTTPLTLVKQTYKHQD